MPDFLTEARLIESNLTAWRRDFHRHPELRYEEHRTGAVVAEHLRGLGFSVQTGVGMTGVVGTLVGARERPVALVRVDMDALPIQEENEVDYKSTVPGVMHACGHDGHTAMGMGVASILAKYRGSLLGTVKLVFQPAEEGAGGARAMIADGVLENPRPDISFGIHIQSQTPNGTYLVGDGPVLASADVFSCVVHGKGSHGAEPQKSADSIVAAAHIITALQTIVSRNVEPLKSAIVSLGSIHGGKAFNVIPAEVELTGTIRSFDDDTRALVHRRMHEIVTSVAAAFGASAELKIESIVPAVVNEPTVAAQTRELAARLVGAENVSTNQLSTPSDDVAEFLLAAPGCHFIVGGTFPDRETYPHHNPRFDFNEEALPLGVALLSAEVFHFLENWPVG